MYERYQFRNIFDEWVERFPHVNVVPNTTDTKKFKIHFSEKITKIFKSIIFKRISLLLTFIDFFGFLEYYC